MPTRKQRRRRAKGKRHDYEFVYVDAEGNELDEDEVPEDLLRETRQRAEDDRNGTKPDAKPAAKKGQRAPGRGRRVPQPPSWQRASRRALFLGLFVLVLFSLTAKGNYLAVLPFALLYSLLFIPLTYYIDRFAYRRYQAQQSSGARGAGASSPGRRSAKR
jgi:hypothetical protein